MGSFTSFGLLPALLKGLDRLGLTVPTPVQEHAIPLLMAGKDAIVMAKTGSGKTLAFGLPILSTLRPGNRPQALVVLPTRELALQVCKALADVAEASPLRTLAIYGGVGLGPQETALRNGVDIVVGTPGRLKDLINRGSLDLRQVSILVLDEADEMLDMGFRRDIDFLLNRMPGRQQTLIFSATMPSDIEAIARKHLQSPTVVKLTNDDAVPSEISHHFVRLDPEQRLAGLIALMRRETPDRAIIFTRMKHETKRLAQKLEKAAGFKAGYLNGNMSQNARNRMLDDFRSGAIQYLVATDVAARGLHVDGLSHVFHYAVPTVVETYIHRSGRTGRAGQSGKTIIFVTPESEGDFRSISRQVACDEIPVAGLGLESVVLPPAEPETRPQPSSRQRRPAASAAGNGRGRDRGRAGNGDDSRKQAPAAEARKPATAGGGRRGQATERSQEAASPARSGAAVARTAPANAERRQRSESRPQRAESRPQPISQNPPTPGSMADLWGRSYPKR